MQRENWRKCCATRLLTRLENRSRGRLASHSCINMPLSHILYNRCAVPIQMDQGDLITGIALAAATPLPLILKVYIGSRLRFFTGISFESIILGNLCMTSTRSCAQAAAADV